MKLMKIKKYTIFAIAAVSVLSTFAAPAGASTITTVKWAVDSVKDGFGTGMLDGVTVTYNTLTGISGASYNGINWWTVGAGTSAVCSPCSDDPSASTMGTNTRGFQESISFSAAVVNPILLITYGSLNSSIDLSGLSFALLSSNHTQLSGNVITFSAGSHTIDDGFAVQLNGTFGPQAPITFGFTPGNGELDTIAFTVGQVPEPASLSLAFAGVFGLWIYRRRSAR